jgi:hypothetical protein
MTNEISKIEKKLRQIESGKFSSLENDKKKLEKRLEILKAREAKK